MRECTREKKKKEENGEDRHLVASFAEKETAYSRGINKRFSAGSSWMFRWSPLFVWREKEEKKGKRVTSQFSSSSTAMFASTQRVATQTVAVPTTNRRRKSTLASKICAGSNLEGAESVQLGTAKLPKDIDVDVFSSTMFQWATTLTTSGQNMPFVLPQKVDKTKTGFEMDFLKSNPKDPGSFVSVGTIEAKVEEIEDGAKILFLRGYGDVRIPKKLVDVPIVMQTMPNAIKRAIKVSMP